MIKILLKLIFFSMLTLTLVACGGGGGDSQSTNTDPILPDPILPDPILPVSTEIEANDSIEQANPLTVGETMRGSINSAGDVDWFSINSVSDTYAFTASVEGEYFAINGHRWNAIIYDIDGNEVFRFDIDQEAPVSVSINLPTPGNYYISIAYAYSSSFQPDIYSLTVTN